MSKLENYKGSVDLISGLRAKNNGDFPLMEAHDIQVDESGKRLDTKLEELSSGSGSGGSGTTVTVGDKAQATWNADTKMDIPKNPYLGQYGVVVSVDAANNQSVFRYTSAAYPSSIMARSSGGTAKLTTLKDTSTDADDLDIVNRAYVKEKTRLYQHYVTFMVWKKYTAEEYNGEYYADEIVEFYTPPFRSSESITLENFFERLSGIVSIGRYIYDVDTSDICMVRAEENAILFMKPNTGNIPHWESIDVTEPTDDVYYTVDDIVTEIGA